MCAVSQGNYFRVALGQQLSQRNQSQTFGKIRILKAVTEQFPTAT